VKAPTHSVLDTEQDVYPDCHCFESNIITRLLDIYPTVYLLERSKRWLVVQRIQVVAGTPPIHHALVADTKDEERQQDAECHTGIKGGGENVGEAQVPFVEVTTQGELENKADGQPVGVVVG